MAPAFSPIKEKRLSMRRVWAEVLLHLLGEILQQTVRDKGCGHAEAAVKTFSNVFQLRKDLKARWNEIFKNSNPITLELACDYGTSFACAAKRNSNV